MLLFDINYCIIRLYVSFPLRIIFFAKNIYLIILTFLSISKLNTISRGIYMASFQPAVQSSVSLATTNATGTNLNSTLFAAAGYFSKYRVLEFGSMTEVREDSSISPNSNVYKAALTHFKQPNASTPWLVGKIQADDVTLTATTVTDNSEYNFTIEVYDVDTLVGVTTEISIDSGTSATATTIAGLLFTAIDAVDNVTPTNNEASVTIAADAGYDIVITNLTSKITETFTSSESAADLLAAIIEENENGWYFFECENHSKAFVLDMADEIEATGSGDYPKQYHVSTQESATITPYVQGTSTDTQAALLEAGYLRTAPYWHHNADTLFPEAAMTSIMGSIFPAASTWKFQQCKGVEAVSDLVTGKNLTSGKLSYLTNRNTSFMSSERGVNFNHVGKMASGEWIDTVRAADWLNSELEVRLLNLLVNRSAAGDKISFTEADKQTVLGVIDTLLSEAVTRKILTGYIPAKLKVEPSFSDQALRTLDDISWTGYLAGAVHFILVDGILTYADAELE